MKIFKLVAPAIVFVAVSASAAFGSTKHKPEAKNIVEMAVSAGSFKTLVAAVKAAGLADTLSGEGPYTVFAPTDAAFKKLPASTLNSLLKPENKEKLKAILLYHVISGRVLASNVLALKSGATVATLNGEKITVTHGRHGVRVNKSHVIKTDIVCSNGVIHVIDTVLIPK